MKCFVAVLLLALFAIVMAVEEVPEKKVSEESQVADASRDKRGLVLNAYTPYAAPYTYSSYSLPYAYSPYPYSYYRYPYYNSPYYVV